MNSAETSTRRAASEPILADSAGHSNVAGLALVNKRPSQKEE
jgi:hypothetical protein